jgi:hypothetical protein
LPFDGARAFEDLKKQVAFGPRVPNTDGHRKTRDWLLGELAKTTDRAFLQNFSRTFDGKTLAMSNIVAEINASAPRRVMLCAHWDTRPTADEEIDPARRRRPIPGANDGASGVAVLLELARMFRARRPDVGVQIVLFDGEDFGPGVDRMFLGASHYAKNPACPNPTTPSCSTWWRQGFADLSGRQQRKQRFRDQRQGVAGCRSLEDRSVQVWRSPHHPDDHIPLQRPAGRRLI